MMLSSWLCYCNLNYYEWEALLKQSWDHRMNTVFCITLVFGISLSYFILNEEEFNLIWQKHLLLWVDRFHLLLIKLWNTKKRENILTLTSWYRWLKEMLRFQQIRTGVGVIWLWHHGPLIARVGRVMSFLKYGIANSKEERDKNPQCLLNCSGIKVATIWSIIHS